jgi:hypothetical protein
MRKSFLIVFLALLALSTLALAQGGKGAIAGKVTDSSGAVIVGANVTATNVGTNAKATMVTNLQGEFQLVQLIPGPYQVEFEAKGFKKFLQQGIVVHVGDRLTLDVSLTVGEIAETVTVTGEALLLRTQDAESGEVVTSQFVENLPQLQRDPLQLLRLAGNVQGSGVRAQGGTSDGRDSGDTRLNGGRSQGIEYFVDGVVADTGRAHNVSNAFAPTMEGIAEFKVITNGFSSEYGRASGGVVEVISKSGSNQFHGQAFDYIQNTILNANSWANNKDGIKKDQFNQNIFGGAIGGPIFKDKTFFFGNYEGTRYVRAGSNWTASVPTAAERTGDFSGHMVGGLVAKMYNPFDSKWNPTGGFNGNGAYERTLFPNNGTTIPSDLISPVAIATLKDIPLPNAPPAFGESSNSNFKGNTRHFTNTDTYAIKIDHNFSDRSRLNGRFSHDGYHDEDAVPYGRFGNPTVSLRPGGWGLSLSYTYAISPTKILTARVGGHFSPLYSATKNPTLNTSDIPFDPAFRQFLGNDIYPWVATDAFNVPQPNTGSPSTYNQTVYNASISMSHIIKRHTLKYGYEHRRYYDNTIGGASGNMFPSGGSTLQFNDTVPWNAQQNSNRLADFMLGTPQWTDASSGSNNALNMNYHAAYLQDDISLTSKLKLNVGIRWETETPVTERYNRLYVWDKNLDPTVGIKDGWTWDNALQAAGVNPSSVLKPGWASNGLPHGGMALPKTGTISGRGAQEWHPYNFSPRVGFAYSWDSKTVIRGSVGMMYSSTAGDPRGMMGPSKEISTADNVRSNDALLTQGPGWLATRDVAAWHPQDYVYFKNTPEGINYQATSEGPQGIGPWDRTSHMPHEWLVSAGVQRELGREFVVEAMYSGNYGRSLMGMYPLSQFPIAAYQPGNTALNNTKIESPFVAGTTQHGEQMTIGALEFTYPQFSNVVLEGNNFGRSNYHSMNIRLERRYSHGFNFLVNYTLGRLYDDVGGPNTIPSADAGFNTQAQSGGRPYQSVAPVSDRYGVDPLDERHRLSVVYNILLPFGRNRHFLGNPQGTGGTILDYIVGGWELSGMSLWRSGRPVLIQSYQVDASSRVYSTFGSYAYATQTLVNPAWNGDWSSAFASNKDDYTKATPTVDLNAMIPAKSFTLGTLPAVYDGIRAPGSLLHDLSLMKKFPLFSKDGLRYIQTRVEATNLFNSRGFGAILLDPARPEHFGQIDSAGYQERHIQVSLRVVF